MKSWLRFAVATALVAFAFQTQAQAAIITGGAIVVATDGHVIATYQGNSASFSNDLYLDAPANGLGVIFNNHTSPVGSSVDLGFFTAGTELIFRLHVNNTGDDFYSGSPSRNADGKAHARVNDGWSPTETLVEFEDLLNTPEGEFGFNDLRFSFTNVVAANPEVPEPATLTIWGLGALGCAFAAYRRRKAA